MIDWEAWEKMHAGMTQDTSFRGCASQQPSLSVSAGGPLSRAKPVSSPYAGLTAWGAFLNGVAGFIICALFASLLWLIVTEIWSAGFNDGYTCAAYGTHCHGDYKERKP
jgi:hypothetical protein